MTQAEFEDILAKRENDWDNWTRYACEAWDSWTPAERAAATLEKLEADVEGTLLSIREEEEATARPVSELIESDIPRDHMTETEERAFVAHWFDEYERTGFAKTFDSPYSDEKKYKGQTFEVLGRCREDAYDLEVLPVWKIRLECGDELDAYPEEICNLEREKSAAKASQSAPNTIQHKTDDREEEPANLGMKAQEKGTAGEEVVLCAYMATMETKYGTEQAVVYEDTANPIYANEDEIIRALMAELDYEPFTDPNSEYPGFWGGDEDVGAYFEYQGSNDITLPKSLVAGIRKELEEKFLLAEANARHFKEERDALLSELKAMKAAKAQEAASSPETRIVETPAGQIVAYPKHEVDSPEDYPGIYVDLILPNEEKLMLACVEYDSCDKGLLGTIYGNALSDEPTDHRHYENIKELQAECRKEALSDIIQSAEGRADNSSATAPQKDMDR